MITTKTAALLLLLCSSSSSNYSSSNSSSWGVQALWTPQKHLAFLGAPTLQLQHSLRCSRQQQQQQQELLAARKPFVGGNWKCNGTIKGAETILQMLNDAPAEVDDIEVVIAPPSLHAGFLLRGLRRPFSVALQDSSQVKSFGAYTGEIAPQMAKGESNETVAEKAKNAVDNGLQVIACIGETLEARQNGKTMEVLGKQLQALSSSLSVSDWGHIVLAYEPVWAIGTGKTATPDVAQQTHNEIREWLRRNVGSETAENVRIIYGGSVKGSNAKELFAGPDVDGFLVGGASLTDDFHAILKGARSS